jgi:uncharacterized DUF497 family protein
MRICSFEWDDGNCLHIELGHGIAPDEAEQVFARGPLFKRTKKGHYAVFGPTTAGRYLVVIFELKAKGVARVITGWDMKPSEIRYYRRQGTKK